MEKIIIIYKLDINYNIRNIIIDKYKIIFIKYVINEKYNNECKKIIPILYDKGLHDGLAKSNEYYTKGYEKGYEYGNKEGYEKGSKEGYEKCYQDMRHKEIMKNNYYEPYDKYMLYKSYNESNNNLQYNNIEDVIYNFMKNIYKSIFEWIM